MMQFVIQICMRGFGFLDMGMVMGMYMGMGMGMGMGMEMQMFMKGMENFMVEGVVWGMNCNEFVQGVVVNSWFIVVFFVVVWVEFFKIM